LARKLTLEALVADLAATVKMVDARNPTGRDPRFKPGVGPLTESELTTAVSNELTSRDVEAYRQCRPAGYPNSRATCDLLLPGQWALEIKLARPFGDNGKPAERWSENLLYPYPGNVSSIGDCLKLVASGFAERLAVIVIGYEHTPPKIALEPAVRAFELIATQVCGISLSKRAEALVKGLVHPHHQQARLYGWQVLRPVATE
jgi:hypothetical protein